MSNETQETMPEVSKEAGQGEEIAAQAATDGLPKEAKDNVVPLKTDSDDKGDPRSDGAAKVVVTQETKQVAHTFRQLADKIEAGELNNLDFAIVIPKLQNGDMPLLFLGNPIPNVMLEGLLHRMLTKMAFQ